METINDKTNTIMKTKEETLVCSKCGGTHVHIKAWVDANTHEFDHEFDEDTCWCMDCNEERDLVPISEWKLNCGSHYTPALINGKDVDIRPIIDELNQTLCISDTFYVGMYKHQLVEVYWSPIDNEVEVTFHEWVGSGRKFERHDFIDLFDVCNFDADTDLVCFRKVDEDERKWVLSYFNANAK